jgi:signal transduction histidine kinase
VRLIDDLSMFARLGGHATQPVDLDLNPLIQRSMDRAMASYPHPDAEGLIHIRMPKTELRVTGHESMLHQLFENLIGNALKYRSPHAPDLRIAARREGDRVIVSVADNGLGIPAPDRQRVMKMFERVAGREQLGTGIGLSISARIAEMHGSSLEISDGHGDTEFPGTTFQFSLPRASSK